jgi:hypothetical protein
MKQLEKKEAGLKNKGSMQITAALGKLELIYIYQ